MSGALLMIHPNTPIPNWIIEYIGLPFEARGRTRAGIDCWGLLRLIYAERFGIDLPEFLGYDDVSDRDELAPFIRERMGQWKEIGPSAARLGDCILFSIGGEPMHVGMYLCPFHMLHVTNGGDSCIESLDAPMWRSRIIGFYRRELES